MLWAQEWVLEKRDKVFSLHETYIFVEIETIKYNVKKTQVLYRNSLDLNDGGAGRPRWSLKDQGKTMCKDAKTLRQE